ncbi:hypothetical protein [Edaphocola aurantiacus]|uniref:hypothetical protein n=1 Tax=Edaphocola aurantiacus TaxID=2601682 RepID=UPI001C949EC0|nr:hypothetical protein [Edaphocola aurantiacus]
MKKLSIILLSTISLFNLVSCGKKSHGTDCPVKQCEYGMNPATCECNPNPNDTTTNPVDTGTVQPLKSKFGNGSNGTVDTTVNWATGKDIFYWEANDFSNFRSVFENRSYIPLVYEVEIDGQLRGTLTASQNLFLNFEYSKDMTMNLYRPAAFKINFGILDIDSLPSSTYDIVNSIQTPFYKLSETNTSGTIVYMPDYTWYFGLGHCILQGMYNSPNLYQEYSMKLQLLSNTPTDRRFYLRIYIKHDNIKYIIRTVFKA